jgi:hypothetical protein
MNNRIKALLVIFITFFSSPSWSDKLNFQLIKDDLSGMCLDNLEDGCQGRHLPFRGLKIDFCEETCSLINPINIEGISATAFDLECLSDNATPLASRVLLILSNNQSENPDLMFIRSDFYKSTGSNQLETSISVRSVVTCQ